jgi:hypothetical protein
MLCDGRAVRSGSAPGRSGWPPTAETLIGMTGGPIAGGGPVSCPSLLRESLHRFRASGRARYATRPTVGRHVSAGQRLARRRPPEPCAQVRVLLGAPSRSGNIASDQPKSPRLRLSNRPRPAAMCLARRPPRSAADQRAHWHTCLRRDPLDFLKVLGRKPHRLHCRRAPPPKSCLNARIRR